MKLAWLLAATTLGCAGSLAWVSAEEAEKSVEEQKQACVAAIKEDEARDESKLTDAYKARCQALMTATPPLQPVRGESGSGTETATATASGGGETANTAEVGGGGANAVGDASVAAVGLNGGNDTGGVRVGAFAETTPEARQQAFERSLGVPNYPTAAPQIAASSQPEHQPTSPAQQALNRSLLQAENDVDRITQRQQAFEQSLATPEYPTSAPQIEASSRPEHQPTSELQQSLNRAQLVAEERVDQLATERLAQSTATASQDEAAAPRPNENTSVAQRPNEDEPAVARPNDPQAEARATASRTATEQLRQGLLANTRQGIAMQILQHCRELGYNEQVCASSVRVAQKESKFDPRAQNPTSTAHGLYQYIDRTWASECTRNTGNSLAWCQANRSNAEVQNRVMFETVNQRYQRYESGSLNCRGIQGFDACNYIVYHHTFAAGNPIGYYNQAIRNADAAYQAAFSSLANTSPDVALAQLSLTQGTTFSAPVGGTTPVVNASLGYYGTGGSGYSGSSYSPSANLGYYQDTASGYGNYGYSNPVSYAPYQPSYQPSMAAGGGGYGNSTATLPVITNPGEVTGNTGTGAGATTPQPTTAEVQQLRPTTSPNNPNLVTGYELIRANTNPVNVVPSNLPENSRGYDALRQGNGV